MLRGRAIENLCWYCNGSGHVRTCPVCYGKGTIRRKKDQPEATCNHCHGIGEIPLPWPWNLVLDQSRPCPKCNPRVIKRKGKKQAAAPVKQAAPVEQGAAENLAPVQQVASVSPAESPAPERQVEPGVLASSRKVTAPLPVEALERHEAKMKQTSAKREPAAENNEITAPVRVRRKKQHEGV